MIGAQLLESQGRALLLSGLGDLKQGQLPLVVAQGLLVAIEGALLLTRVLTDAFEFACCFGHRLAMGRAVQRWLRPGWFGLIRALVSVPLRPLVSIPVRSRFRIKFPDRQCDR